MASSRSKSGQAVESRLYDAVVVGSGATGMWAARKLSLQGFSVALLEAGGPPAKSYGQGVHPAALVSGHGLPAYTSSREHPYSWRRIQAIGGRLNAWGAFCLRMSDLDFRAAEMDQVGECWPIGYADLSAHYAEVEKALRIRGQKDNHSCVPDSEYLSSYPMTPTQLRFKERITSRWSDRSVIVGRLATRYHGYLIWPAVWSGQLKLFSARRATQVTEADGRATGILTLNTETGKQEEFRGRAVLLCASTIETTRLLMNSRSQRHPQGIGGSSGILGRYLMDHTCVTSEGVILPEGTSGGAEPDLAVSYLPRFSNLGKRDRDYLRGFGIQVFFRKCEGAGSCEWAEKGAPPHRAHFLMMSFGEVLPNRENRASIKSEIQNSEVPWVHIDFRFGENERKMQIHQVETLNELAEAGSFHVMRGPEIEPAGTAMHELGTARMGNRQESSVCNRFNQVWDMPNVHVMDGAAFVSAGFQNPTLTMMAICDRACEHLSRQLRKGKIELLNF